MDIQDLINRIEAAKSNLQGARNNVIPPVMPEPIICPEELNENPERDEKVKEGFLNGMANGRVTGFLVGLSGGPGTAIAGAAVGGLIGGVVGAEQAGSAYDAEHGEENEQGQCEQPVA